MAEDAAWLAAEVVAIAGCSTATGGRPAPGPMARRTARASPVKPSGAMRYTLKRKSRTSPSFTTYSFPSTRILPASLAPCSPLRAM